MIFNLYTYLFFSLMAAGSAVSVLIKTVIDSNRRIMWSTSSTSFLIQIIISVIILFTGIIVVDPDVSDITGSFVFVLVFFFFFCGAFYFFKIITFPIVLLTLLGLYFIFGTFLKDFIPFENNQSFTISLLQKHNGIASVEIKGFDDEITFREIEENQRYPVFLVVDFSEYLFFLRNSSYLKFNGFIPIPEEYSEILESDFLESGVSRLPFARVRFYESNPIEIEIYSVLSIFPRRNGELNFQTEK